MDGENVPGIKISWKFWVCEEGDRMAFFNGLGEVGRLYRELGTNND